MDSSTFRENLFINFVHSCVIYQKVLKLKKKSQSVIKNNFHAKCFVLILFESVLYIIFFILHRNNI